MKSTESDVCYFEVDAVFNREPVELLEENTGNDMGKEVLCFFGPLMLYIRSEKFLRGDRSGRM